MQREMRRKRQRLGFEETAELMRAGTCGVLALQGDDGYPYAVPLSYVWSDEAPREGFVGRVYFHSAAQGYKIDAIKGCDKASFTVVGQDLVVPHELTTYFRSAIATGRVRILEDEVERLAGLRALGERYNPGQNQRNEDEIAGGLGRVAVIALDVEELSGKEAVELMRERRRNCEQNVNG